MHASGMAGAVLTAVVLSGVGLAVLIRMVLRERARARWRMSQIRRQARQMGPMGAPAPETRRLPRSGAPLHPLHPASVPAAIPEYRGYSAAMWARYLAVRHQFELEAREAALANMAERGVAPAPWADELPLAGALLPAFQAHDVAVELDALQLRYTMMPLPIDPRTNDPAEVLVQVYA